jgi:type IV secretory pathway VirB10-like protein
MPSPHFVDERTVMSARPVVPLEKIETKVRHRRQWLLGGAFAFAMILGAASALLGAYWKLSSAPAPATEVSKEVNPAPVTVAESVQAATPEVEKPGKVEEPAPAITPKKDAPPVKHPTTVARQNSESAEARDNRRLNEEAELDRIRQAVLVDEWQERRARRAARHERRQDERYNHRDLSNLDEIFEGRRRPE